MSKHLVAVVLLTALVASGCGPAASNKEGKKSNANDKTQSKSADPHDVPLTKAEIEKLRGETAEWPAAIARIQKYRDTIKAETTGGEPAKAHRSLDLLDYVLQWLPDIAQKSAIPKESWQAIGENAQKLRDAFNAVHARIDAGKSPDYASVAKDIEASIQVLTKIKSKASATSQPKSK